MDFSLFCSIRQFHRGENLVDADSQGDLTRYICYHNADAIPIANSEYMMLNREKRLYAI